MAWLAVAPVRCTIRLTTFDWFGSSVRSRACHPLAPSRVPVPPPGQVENTRGPAWLDTSASPQRQVRTVSNCAVDCGVFRGCGYVLVSCAATSVTSWSLVTPIVVQRQVSGHG